jgi:uncharacterized protein YndB with AHSA1/START domain
MTDDVEGIRRIEPIRRSVTVHVPPDRAFRVFTEQMTEWWPHQTHSRAAREFDDEPSLTVRSIELQGRVGGLVLEHMSDGRALPWAEVIGWDPPNRFAMAWRPHTRPEPPTEVEVTFTPIEGGTRVELEHRGWERLTELRDELYESYGGGWIDTLGRFAALVDEEAA